MPISRDLPPSPAESAAGRTLELPRNPLPLGTPLSPVKVAGSKSVCNRALLLAAMAPGRSRLLDGLEAEDTCRMRDCLRLLGIPLMEEPGDWTIQGGEPPVPSGPLPAGASGTTLRFLLPWLALTTKEPIRFIGDRRLFERPLGGLLEALKAFGASWETFSGEGLLVPAAKPPSSLDLYPICKVPLPVRLWNCRPRCSEPPALVEHPGCWDQVLRHASERETRASPGHFQNR